MAAQLAYIDSRPVIAYKASNIVTLLKEREQWLASQVSHPDVVAIGNAREGSNSFACPSPAALGTYKEAEGIH